VAADVYSHRETGDVSRSLLNVDGKSSDSAAEALRAYSEGVYGIEHTHFEVGVKFFWVADSNVTAEGFFSEESAKLEVAADAYAYNHRRTRFAACNRNGVTNKVYDVIDRSRRGKHFNSGHIFAAEALRAYIDAKAVALDDINVNDGRGIVVSVDSFERVRNDRFSEKTVGVAFRDAPVDSITEASADDMSVLTDFDKDDSHTCVLTDGQVFRRSGIEVSAEVIENRFACI